MTKNKGNSKGYTTLEVIVVTLIATMIISAITGFMMIMTKSYELNQELVDMQYQAQITLNTLVEEIKYSSGITGVSTAAGADIGMATEKQAVDLLCLKQTDNQYTYLKLQEGNLYIKEDMIDGTLTYDVLMVEKEELLATRLERLQITPLNGTLLETNSVNVEISFKGKKGSELTVSNQATIRNK